MERRRRDQAVERLGPTRLALGLVRIAHPLLVLELAATRFALVLVNRHLQLLVAEANNAHGELAVNIYQFAASEHTAGGAQLERTRKWSAELNDLPDR